MRGAQLAMVVLAACESGATRDATRPRDAVDQLMRCAFDGVSGDDDTGRVEAALRHALRRDRVAFATRAGRCESALASPGGAHTCVAALKAQWSLLLTVAQRSAVDVIDQDVAVRRVGDAYTEALRRCPR